MVSGDSSDKHTLCKPHSLIGLGKSQASGVGAATVVEQAPAASRVSCPRDKAATDWEDERQQEQCFKVRASISREYLKVRTLSVNIDERYCATMFMTLAWTV